MLAEGKIGDILIDYQTVLLGRFESVPILAFCPHAVDFSKPQTRQPVKRSKTTKSGKMVYSLGEKLAKIKFLENNAPDNCMF